MKYIDISTFQRTVDFESVKGNVDGVIIRAGYGAGNIDAQFRRNAGECNRLGIPQSEMSGTTTEDVRAWMGEKKPVILLKRTTPVTWQLPSHAVKTLLGENNYWADTGAVTVDYRADLDLYIEKKIGE